MRTTLNLDTERLTAIKNWAQQPQAPFKLKLLVKKGNLAAGVDLNDRDALYRTMEGKRSDSR